MLVGELLSGILLGIIVNRYSGAFPVLLTLPGDEVFRAITDLGIFVVMLLAGVELRPRDLAASSKNALWVALGGMLVPLGLGLLTARLFIPPTDRWFEMALFLGVALAITAVPAAVKVLLDMGRLDTRVGRTIVSAAIFDDVFSLILLAVLTAVIRTGSSPGGADLLALAGRVLLFFVATFLGGRFLLPALGRRVRRIRLPELEFSFLLIVALGFGVLAEVLHLHFILGAFAAGLFFGRGTINTPVYEDVRRKVTALSTGFLAPVFFASIGLHLDPSAITAVPLFLLFLLVAAMAGKVLGAGLPALWSGATRREAAAIGVGMNARGAVELVIADIALRAGLFSHGEVGGVVNHVFSSVVIMAIVTTLVTPILLKPLLVSNGSNRYAGPPGGARERDDEEDPHATP